METICKGKKIIKNFPDISSRSVLDIISGENETRERDTERVWEDKNGFGKKDHVT